MQLTEKGQWWRGRRGATMVLVAVALVAMMGMATIAIDLGMLIKTRAEAQRAADATALAGASAFLLDLSVDEEADSALARARRLADNNYMAGTRIDSLAELEVWVISDSQKVRTRVRRAAVPTWFARVFGVNTLPVGAKAAAVADYASGTACVKPIAVPDLWQDAGDSVANGGDGDRRYDPPETWLWNGAPTPDTYQTAHYAGDGTGTGLGSDWRNTYAFERDWGLQIVLRPSVSAGDPMQPCPGSLQGNKCYTPSFWGLWGSNSNSQLSDWILSCREETSTVGTTEPVTGGWRQALNKDVKEVYNRDPSARWDSLAFDALTTRKGTVVSSTLGDNWRSSPRVWIMAIMAPGDVPQVPSDGDTVFNNFMLFFVEGCINENGNGPLSANCNTKTMLVGRFVGLAQGTQTGPAPGTMIRILRLVE